MSDGEASDTIGNVKAKITGTGKADPIGFWERGEGEGGRTPAQLAPGGLGSTA